MKTFLEYETMCREPPPGHVFVESSAEDRIADKYIFQILVFDILHNAVDVSRRVRLSL